MRTPGIWAIVASVPIVFLVSGCQTLCGGANVEKQITETLNLFKAGLESKDIDKTMAAFSGSFQSSEFGDKSAARGEVQGYFTGGELNNAQVDLEKAEYTRLEDGTYQVYPVPLRASFGSGILGFKMKPDEDGVWRAYDMTFEQF